MTEQGIYLDRDIGHLTIIGKDRKPIVFIDDYFFGAGGKAKRYTFTPREPTEEIELTTKEPIVTQEELILFVRKMAEAKGIKL